MSVSIGAVVLAAGMAVRMGRQKLLLPLDGKPMLTHVLEVVERLCDRVAIINQGRMVIEGSMEELRSAQDTLEDIFVRVVGGERMAQSLDWL